MLTWKSFQFRHLAEKYFAVGFGAPVALDPTVSAVNLTADTVAATTFPSGPYLITVLAPNRVFDHNPMLRRVLARWNALPERPLPPLGDLQEGHAFDRDMHRLLMLEGVRVVVRPHPDGAWTWRRLRTYTERVLHLWLNPRGDGCSAWD